MNDGRGTVLYERYIDSEGHHDHMICLNCRKIIEFVSSEIERLQEEHARQHNFKLVDHTLRLEGYCAECR